jgi:hypothetical protein
MQHVHDRHAGGTVRGVRSELIASDAAHVQVRQGVLERAPNLDARGSEARVEYDEQASSPRIGSDASFFVRTVRLQLDRRRLVLARDDVDIDAEIAVKCVRHPAEPNAEGRKNSGFVADPVVPRLHDVARFIGFVRNACYRAIARRAHPECDES